MDSFEDLTFKHDNGIKNKAWVEYAPTLRHVPESILRRRHLGKTTPDHIHDSEYTGIREQQPTGGLYPERVIPDNVVNTGLQSNQPTVIPVTQYFHSNNPHLLYTQHIHGGAHQQNAMSQNRQPVMTPAMHNPRHGTPSPIHIQQHVTGQPLMYSNLQQQHF